MSQVRKNAASQRWQYASVDFESRQVAEEPKRRWNERLTAVRDIEATLSRLRDQEERQGMSTDEREACLALGANLVDRRAVDPETPRQLRLRDALVEIVLQ